MTIFWLFDFGTCNLRKDRPTPPLKRLGEKPRRFLITPHFWLQSPSNSSVGLTTPHRIICLRRPFDPSTSSGHRMLRDRIGLCDSSWKL